MDMITETTTATAHEEITEIEIQEWEPDSDRAGYLRRTRRKTIGEVEKLLVSELTRMDMIDESMGVFPTVDRSQPFPEGRIACFAVTGHYVHIEVLQKSSVPRAEHSEARLIFLGKTFQGWEHAWKLAEACARLLRA
jgi:hypothetical protein